MDKIMQIRAQNTPEANEPDELNLFNNDKHSHTSEENSTATIEIIKDGGIDVIPIP